MVIKMTYVEKVKNCETTINELYYLTLERMLKFLTAKRNLLEKKSCFLLSIDFDCENCQLL